MMQVVTPGATFFQQIYRAVLCAMLFYFKLQASLTYLHGEKNRTLIDHCCFFASSSAIFPDLGSMPNLGCNRLRFFDLDWGYWLNIALWACIISLMVFVQHPNLSGFFGLKEVAKSNWNVDFPLKLSLLPSLLDPLHKKKAIDSCHHKGDHG